MKRRFSIQLPDVLMGISVGTGFTGMAGIAGTLDLDTTTIESCIWAAGFFAVCAVTGILAYLESGRRRR